MSLLRAFGGAAIAVVVVGAAPSRAQAFCGFFVAGNDAKLTNNASQVVLMRKGNRTVMTMSNNYQGPPENFAMVVPVPVVLQKENVRTLPREIQPPGRTPIRDRWAYQVVRPFRWSTTTRLP